MTNPQPGWGAPTPDPNQPAWQPPPPPVKKGIPGVVIALIVVLVLAVVGVGGYFGFQKFIADDDSDSDAGDEKKTSKDDENLVAPEGEPFTVVVPTSMKILKGSPQQNEPSLRLELKEPVGDDPEATANAGTYDALEGKDLEELSSAIVSDAHVTPEKMTVGGRVGVAYAVTRGGESAPASAPVTTPHPSATSSPSETPKADPSQAPAAGGTEIRVVLVPMDDGSVIAFNCSWDAANAKAMITACESMIKSVKFTEKKSPGEEKGEDSEPTGEPSAASPDRPSTRPSPATAATPRPPN